MIQNGKHVHDHTREVLKPSQDEKPAKQQRRGKQHVIVHFSEHLGFDSQRFVGQHRSQSPKEKIDRVQIQQAGDRHEFNDRREKLVPGQAVPPIQERRQAKVDQAEDFRAIQL